MTDLGWPRLALGIGLALYGGAAKSQEVSVGELGPPFGTFNRAGTYTIIELGSPANRAGSVASAAFLWSDSPCASAVAIKFFRPEVLPLSTTFHYLTERGPFDVQARTQSVALIPPVQLLKGDLIAITKVGSCGDAVQGGPSSPLIPPPHGSVAFNGDVRTDVVRGPEEPGLDVNVQANDDAGLALLGGRFLATLVAVNPRGGFVVQGFPVPQADRFGYFSLPDFTGDPTFPEVIVKMADATGAPPPFGGAFWVFHAPLTDVEYTLTITDQTHGTARVYTNAPSSPGQLCGGVDTSAFPP